MSYRLRKTSRRGSVMIYAITTLIVLCGIASLGYEFGRVQLAKSQLQTAADTAARYAGSGVKHQIDNVNAAVGMARASLAENWVDGRRLVDAQSTVEVGIWKANSGSKSGKFTVSSDVNKINAVRVTVELKAKTNTAVPLIFGSIIGKPMQELSATAIALYEADANTSMAQLYVPATSNPFLAGSAAGTVASLNNPHNNPDYAGTSSVARQSPVRAPGLTLKSGSALTFDGVNGGANNLSSDIRYNGDGNPDNVVTNTAGAENGKTNLRAPINSVVAIFLTDATPIGTSGLPAGLDFSTTASRDFATISPEIGQTFFIGDGRRDDGDLQRFVVPKGATRLFVGTMDAYEWNNNVGGFDVLVTTPATVTLVR